MTDSYIRRASPPCLANAIWLNALLKLSLLSGGRAAVKCICECNQSRHRVVFYPEPVAMSTTPSGWWSVFCSLKALLLFLAA